MQTLLPIYSIMAEPKPTIWNTDAPIKKFKVDAVIKQILRAFRYHLKKQFYRIFGSKQYDWRIETMRYQTKRFFISQYQMNESEYVIDENVLVVLIFNTKSNNFVRQMTTISSHSIIKLFKNIFGQRPNKKNLKAFFDLEIIQKLWFNKEGFHQSNKLKDIILALTEDQRSKLSKYMRTVQPFWTNILNV